MLLAEITPALCENHIKQKYDVSGKCRAFKVNLVIITADILREWVNKFARKCGVDIRICKLALSSKECAEITSARGNHCLAKHVFRI
jgi:uncharacterized Fe-S cluster-containing radical SAM superfamily protein